MARRTGPEGKGLVAWAYPWRPSVTIDKDVRIPNGEIGKSRKHILYLYETLKISTADQQSRSRRAWRSYREGESLLSLNRNDRQFWLRFAEWDGAHVP